MNSIKCNVHKFAVVLLLLLITGSAWAQAEEEGENADEPVVQEQDDVSKALDSTATQWSFQFSLGPRAWITLHSCGSSHRSCLKSSHCFRA